MDRNSQRNMLGRIWDEYMTGVKFKAALGNRGLYEQNSMNERFFAGDQWHGANCGNDRPLVRHNVIKRIGDYKIALISKNKVAVNYSADGVTVPVSMNRQIKCLRAELSQGKEQAVSHFSGLTDTLLATEKEIGLVMDALSDYFDITSERVKFTDIQEQALRNAYISGTGIVYTWWDDRIPTGLYADDGRTTPIRGDISCQVLDVENVYFGDPNLDDIQEQPFIMIAQRRDVEDLRREARRYQLREYEVQSIRPDGDTAYMAGEHSGNEPPESGKATVLTKFWKEWNADGTEFVIKAVRVCNKTVIRPAWDIGIRQYPFAKMSWERRRSCAYGESEITYLIPNQIAINRMITASVWAVIMMGMPIMVVNSDIVTSDVTNDPGQVIPVCSGSEDAQSAIRYVDPPKFSPAFDENIASLIGNTLKQAGANDVVLGDVRPDNTSAIMAVRETATLPLLSVQNRFYSFIEDIARIWAEFWVTHYGQRKLKIRDESGTWYLPFNGERYRGLLISTRVDVGPAVLWGEEQSIHTLDSLLDRKVIDPVQYLTRLPKGTVPELSRLINELKNPEKTAADA
ncbi:MAG: hypothetical protein PHR24_02135 [Oscillospiraceae bacterium]|nr:hypothetical protein [Oscillospiraceae bacterium]MDD4546079.1 hypothetical protein [Oscillospiraceae bacterium]